MDEHLCHFNNGKYVNLNPFKFKLVCFVRPNCIIQNKNKLLWPNKKFTEFHSSWKSLPFTCLTMENA